jgi:hypothetical protein
MRWRLILEEYGPELLYINGHENVVADALSRLDTDVTHIPSHTVNVAEHYGQEKLSSDMFPVTYSLLDSYQRMDKPLQNLLCKTGYHHHSFHGGGKIYKLICKNKKIVIPNALQEHVVRWYHNVLCHPGRTRTEETIKQNFTFTDLKKKVHQHCDKCLTCQMTKRDTKKYGLLPEKTADDKPWEKLCVDLIGPYTLKRKHKESLRLWCTTMIDPATG